MKKFLTIIVSFFFVIQSILFVVPVTQNVRADDINEIIDSTSCGNYVGPCCVRKANKTLDLKIPNLNMPFPLNLLNEVSSLLFNNIASPLLRGAFSGVNDLIFDTILGSPIQDNQPYCVEGEPETLNGSCTCLDKQVQNLNRLCEPIQDRKEQTQCLNCVRDAKGIWTGIGCLYTDLGKLVQERIAGTFVGIGGAMALLCIIYAAFILQTSRGNPERIKKAKEMLRACITGLLLIIFSVLILKVIGVDILRIPGFGS